MNIAIDISPLKSGHYLQHRVRGTGFYINNLLGSLRKYYPDNKYILFKKGDLLPKKVDLVHVPYFEPFFLTLPLISKNKTVVTVHDLTPLVFPDQFKAGIKGMLKWQVQKFNLKKSSLIITDSQSSKKDIVKYAGIPEPKINVVYLAAGGEFKKVQSSKFKVQSLRKKYKLPEKFVLYVGDVTWNKNLPRLVKAIQKIKVSLVMVGNALSNDNFDKGNPWNQDLAELNNLIKDDKLIKRLGFVENEDLVWLYNTATMLVMPSLYEGFGLPILEAMSSGCPVITSKEGSLEEIAGGAAYFVDAYSIESIADGIKRVFENKSIQEDLSNKGLLQAKKFSWKKTAENTMMIYEYFIKNEK